jgi:DNA helicase-2/ATP-dependent DNA helicase PcrA
MLQLRPAQAEILQYRYGRMAISAVPGSGKTFTLSLLAAQLIAENHINTQAGQQILIVTYLNSSVDTFRARIRQRLDEQQLPQTGFDVRTLHSLASEIVRTANSSFGPENSQQVLDEGQTSNFLAIALDGWLEQNPEVWQQFLQEDTPQNRARWRTLLQNTAKAYIRTAKNARWRPSEITHQLESKPTTDFPFVQMLNAIYGRYQTILDQQGHLDFDDLIWQAADLLVQRPHLADELRRRWPYVLEDEAQDSVPLQELLLQTLTGPQGNWVRVGDPNQAITSTFTAAHPRFFNAFSDLPDVTSHPLPNSGRCAPLILGAANAVLDWVIDNHPVPEVRQHTFRRQHILPTPPGDAQPNPPDSEASIEMRVYKHREDEEIPTIAQTAIAYTRDHPEHTIAILVPTNNLGYALAEQLDDLDANYDNLLRGGTREREIAAAIHAVLSLLANPLDTKALMNAHASLYELDHPAALIPEENLERFHILLKSVHRPELLLFPWEVEDVLAALPANIATAEDEHAMVRFAEFLRGLFALRPLPIDDLTLALADELFAWGDVHEADLAIAYQIAGILRSWRDAQPDMRLPDLAAELQSVATGRRSLPISAPSDFGFEPQPGRITLSTQHSAKGLEWDAVYLVGIDGVWIPGSLDAYFQGVNDLFGGDPQAEAIAQLRYLMADDAGIYNGRSATESAHIDIISERLRLLYVGLTRAKRHLHLSRSRATRQYNKERTAEPATVMGVIYRYLQNNRAA